MQKPTNAGDIASDFDEGAWEAGALEEWRPPNDNTVVPLSASTKKDWTIGRGLKKVSRRRPGEGCTHPTAERGGGGRTVTEAAVGQ